MSEKSEPFQIEGSLVETLAESDLASILVDASELTLDSFLEDGLLRDLPVFATLTSIWKTGRNIRDLLFLKKLALFLNALKDVSSSDRKEMIRRLEEDDSYNQRVGESVIFLLERLDHSAKPALVGLAFRAYCARSIDAVQLQRINRVLERAYMNDLDELERHVRGGGTGFPTPLGQSLVDCGLAWSPPNLSTTAIKPTDIFNPFVENILLPRSEGHDET